MPQAPADRANPSPEQPMLVRFSVVHLIYAVTLLATSLGTFGELGLFVGMYFTAIWAVVFFSRSCLGALLLALLVTLACPCLLPAVSRARETARRMSCLYNLKQIALALHNYESDYGRFPPACITDDQGQPLHSWRVLLLPYLEGSVLYEAYDFNEPWDGPNNRKLADVALRTFSCPVEADKPVTTTSYVAVVGPHTAWPGAQPSRFDDFTDGTSNTLLVVEVKGSGIHWMEPRDLHVVQTAPGVNPI